LGEENFPLKIQFGIKQKIKNLRSFTGTYSISTKLLIHLGKIKAKIIKREEKIVDREFKQ
jgi:hypothetical protein